MYVRVGKMATTVKYNLRIAAFTKTHVNYEFLLLDFFKQTLYLFKSVVLLQKQIPHTFSN